MDKRADRLDRELRKGKSPMLEAREKAITSSINQTIIIPKDLRRK